MDVFFLALTPARAFVEGVSNTKIKKIHVVKEVEK